MTETSFRFFIDWQLLSSGMGTWQFLRTFGLQKNKPDNEEIRALRRRIENEELVEFQIRHAMLCFMNFHHWIGNRDLIKLLRIKSLQWILKLLLLMGCLNQEELSNFLVKKVTQGIIQFLGTISEIIKATLLLMLPF